MVTIAMPARQDVIVDDGPHLQAPNPLENGLTPPSVKDLLMQGARENQIPSPFGEVSYTDKGERFVTNEFAPPASHSVRLTLGDGTTVDITLNAPPDAKLPNFGPSGPSLPYETVNKALNPQGPLVPFKEDPQEIGIRPDVVHVLEETLRDLDRKLAPLVNSNNPLFV